MSTKETFPSFQDAVEFYKTEHSLRYAVVVEMDEPKHTATLRTGEYPADRDCYVVIWPQMGHSEKVWAEEY